MKISINQLTFAAATALLGAIALSSTANAQNTLEKIRTEGKMTVATEAALPPFEFVRDGQIIGYGKDILDRIVADLDVSLEQFDMPFQGILPGLIAGNFDFVATSVAMTEERASNVDFTLPVGVYETGILVADRNEAIQKIDDLSGKAVGTQLGSALEPVLDQIDEYLNSQGLDPIADRQLFTGFPEIRMALQGGRIDAALDTSPTIGMLLAEQPDQFRLVDTYGDRAFLGWAVRKGDTALLDYLNQQIMNMHDDGSLEELQNKWFGYKFDLPMTPVEF